MKKDWKITRRFELCNHGKTQHFLLNCKFIRIRTYQVVWMIYAGPRSKFSFMYDWLEINCSYNSHQFCIPLVLIQWWEAGSFLITVLLIIIIVRPTKKKCFTWIHFKFSFRVEELWKQFGKPKFLTIFATGTARGIFRLEPPDVFDNEVVNIVHMQHASFSYTPVHISSKSYYNDVQKNVGKVIITIPTYLSTWNVKWKNFLLCLLC